MALWTGHQCALIDSIARNKNCKQFLSQSDKKFDGNTTEMALGNFTCQKCALCETRNSIQSSQTSKCDSATLHSKILISSQETIASNQSREKKLIEVGRECIIHLPQRGGSLVLLIPSKSTVQTGTNIKW